uniref:peptidylprolyl isomerase n=1 Tax=Leersia perrieri TaxID=77586 RepID=A0A0D9XFM4_9ORYZ
MELSIAPAAMAMGLIAKNPKMINYRYGKELRPQHRSNGWLLSPACSVIFNKQNRINPKVCSVLRAVSPVQCIENSTESSVSFKDFLVSVQTEEDGLRKIRATIAGTMTESIFDTVFSKNLAAAQPLPGFRRMKGGSLLKPGKLYFLSISVQIELAALVVMFCVLLFHPPYLGVLPARKTRDIPKDIALHLIGPSKVKKETIKNIISFTIAEYVQKEGFAASKNLKVLQSFEELEATFEPGKEFCFDAALHLQ